MPSKKSSTPPALGFFGTVKAAFYSPKFYKDLDRREGGKAFGYFALLTLLYVVILGVSLWFGTLRGLGISPESVGEHLSAIYPEELVITVKDAQVSTNGEEPLFVDAPAEWAEFMEAVEVEHLAVIDTATPFSVPQFKEYGAFTWLTNDSLYYVDDQNGEISGAELSEVPDVVVTKSMVDEFSLAVTSTLKKLIPLFAVGGALLLFLGLLAWHSLYLIFVASLISLVRSSLKLPAGFGLSYKTGLYAMTYTYTAMFVMLFINVATPLSFTGFPFMITLITLAGVGLNLKHLKG